MNESHRIYNKWKKNVFFTLKEYEIFLEGGMNNFLKSIEDFHINTSSSPEVSKGFIDSTKKNLQSFAWLFHPPFHEIYICSGYPYEVTESLLREFQSLS